MMGLFYVKTLFSPKTFLIIRSSKSTKTNNTMKQEEINRLLEFKNRFEEIQENSNPTFAWNLYLPAELENEFVNFIDSLIYTYDWTITADDTHRWVDTDGWYEVEFTLDMDGKQVYINTENGDRELEELWSENNPQNVSSIAECYLRNLWDFICFISNIIDAITNKNE